MILLIYGFKRQSAFAQLKTTFETGSKCSTSSVHCMNVKLVENIYTICVFFLCKTGAFIFLRESLTRGFKL
jgi:hypothetical protein